MTTSTFGRAAVSSARIDREEMLANFRQACLLLEKRLHREQDIIVAVAVVVVEP